jgi:RimJ/RimL family protein N-acetyltransferase
MTTTPLEVRAAGHDDLPTVHEILDGAAAWLAERGIRQWPVPYPREPIARALAGGGLWVGARGGRIVATMRTAHRDPGIWGEDPVPALYVHALAARREPLGRGSGLELLRWAARAAAQEGLEVVRLDCVAGNERLRRYYRRAGFRYVGDVDQRVGTVRWRSSLFEIAVPEPAG